MIDREIQSGDIVMLKSGSPKMIVIKSGNQNTVCFLFNPVTGEFKEQDIPTEYLQVVEEPDE